MEDNPKGQPLQPTPVEAPGELAPNVKLAAEKSASHVVSLWQSWLSATHNRRQRFLDFYKQYRGIPNRKNYDGLANVFVNETLDAVESVVAQQLLTIFSESKYLMIAPREKTDEKDAKLMENMMFNALDEMNWRGDKCPAALRQRAKYGTCAVKICWIYESKPIMMRSKTPGGIGAQYVEQSVAVLDRPDVQYIDLLDLAFNVGKQNTKFMKWVVIRKRVDYDYIRKHAKNGVYSQIQVSKISKQNTTNVSDINSREQRMQAGGVMISNLKDDPYEILEFWGKAPKWWVDEQIDPAAEDAEDLVDTVIEVLNGQNITLRCEKNPYWHQEIPVVIDQYIAVDDEGYGLGMCEISESLQQALNDMICQGLDHNSFQNFPPIIRNTAAGVDKAEIVLSPHKIIDCNTTPANALDTMKLGGNFIENLQMINEAKGNIRKNTGATDPIQGVSGNKEQTAFEVNTLLSRGSARINVSTVTFGDKFVKEVYRQVYKLIYQYTDKKKVVRIIGAEGIEWPEVNPEDILLDVDIIPKIPTDFDSRNIQRNQMIQFVTQVLAVYPFANFYKLIRKVYDLFGFDDGDEIIPAPPNQPESQLNLNQKLQAILMGQKVPVAFYEDHLTALAFYIQVLKMAGNRLDPRAMEALQYTIQEHQKYLEAMQQQAQAAAAQGGGASVPGKGGSGTPSKPQGDNGAVEQSKNGFRGAAPTAAQ